jgi:hypothetical protein
MALRWRSGCVGGAVGEECLHQYHHLPSAYNSLLRLARKLSAIRLQYQRKASDDWSAVAGAGWVTVASIRRGQEIIWVEVLSLSL